MAWRYPPQYIGPNYAVDNSPINEAFTAVVGEASGALNEHNFPSSDDILADNLLERSNLSDDAAMRLHYASSPTSTYPRSYNSKTGWVEISIADGWQSFTEDGCTLEFLSLGGATWLNASFNVHCGFNNISIVQKGYGYNFALELDGVMLAESMLGTGDSVSEFYNGPNGRAAKLVPTKLAHLNTPQGGGGIAAARIPIVVDAVVDLTPGPHTLRLLVMNIRGRMRGGNKSGEQYRTPSKETYISTRELFALEMLR